MQIQMICGRMIVNNQDMGSSCHGLCQSNLLAFLQTKYHVPASFSQSLW